MGYEVVDLTVNYSHGMFDTLDEAKGAASFDRLKHYAIFDQRGDRVFVREPKCRNCGQPFAPNDGRHWIKRAGYVCTKAAE